MRIVFMGTTDFAVPPLEALAAAGHDIVGVFTQPDKPRGRSMKLIPSPVKKAATLHGITVYQPASLRKGEDAEKAFADLQKMAPDCIVVAAYGQILPKSVLDLPKYGCINIHASLLPKYRGAAPIQRVILNGEQETGVTVMQMAEGLDTGARLIVQAMEGLAQGTLTAEQQDDSLSCYAAMITKDMSSLDFSRPASELHRIIRALTGFTSFEGKRLKVYRSLVTPGTTGAAPGTITDENSFTVACGGGTCLTFTEVQLEGSKRMQTEEFLRGRKLTRGAVLGE